MADFTQISSIKKKKEACINNKIFTKAYNSFQLFGNFSIANHKFPTNWCRDKWQWQHKKKFVQKMKYFPFFALTWTSQHVICFRPYLWYPNRSILGNFDYKLIKVNSLVTNSDHFSHIVKFFSQKYRDYYLILFNIFPYPFLSVIFKQTWKS